MLAADAVVVVGGASGTLSEMAFAWSYRKPIIALRSSGGWAERLADQCIDHRNDKPIIGVDSLDELRVQLTRILGELSA